MGEVGVCREGRRLVQDRLPHDGLHRLARLPVARLKVLPDLGVADLLEASGAKSGVRKQRIELEKGQPICRKNIQCIAEELIGARAKMVEIPALLQDRGKLRDADKIRTLLLERVEAH